MNIGCNWSKYLKELIEQEKVKIDYIKYGFYENFYEEFETMRAIKPILLHGLGLNEDTGMKDIGVIDFKLLNKLIKECDSPHYGLHLAIKNSDMGIERTEEDIFKHMSNQVKTFKENINVPLILENTPDCPIDRTVFDHYPYVMPEQIKRILVENEVGFLLDLTHAKITAQYRGWNVCDYLANLPLELIKEIHVNGSGRDSEGFPCDTHESMKEEDYELLKFVLSHSNPEIVTLEYVGKEWESDEVILKSLERQLYKLNEIVK